MKRSVKDAYLAQQNSYKRSIDKLKKEIDRIENKIDSLNTVIEISTVITFVSSGLLVGHADYNTQMHLPDNFFTDPLYIVPMGFLTLGAVAALIANKFLNKEQDKMDDKEYLIDRYSNNLQKSVEELEKKDNENFFENHFKMTELGDRTKDSQRDKSDNDERNKDLDDGKGSDEFDKVPEDQTKFSTDYGSKDSINYNNNGKLNLGITEEEFEEAKANGNVIVRVIHGNQSESFQNNQPQEDSDSQGLNE